jgi:hypothetical protein
MPISVSATRIREGVATALGCAASDLPHYLREQQVAMILDLRPTTLRVWRSTKRYSLPYMKSGKLVRYLTEDLIWFMAEQRMTGDQVDVPKKPRGRAK